MAWNDTEIANRALGDLGYRDAIVDLATDTSLQARVLRGNFDLAVEDVLSDAPFGVGLRMGELTIVSDPDVPYNDQYWFAYRYPTGSVLFRAVLPEGQAGRMATEKSQIPWKMHSDASGRLILTDQENAEGEWVVAPASGFLTAKLVLAVALRLAMLSAPRLRRENQSALDLEAPYQRLLSEVKAHNAAESGFEPAPDPPFLRARRGQTGPGWPTRGWLP